MKAGEAIAARGARPAGLRSQDWRSRAACTDADPELFFPPDGASVAAARRICSGCPVQFECLKHALAAPEKWGVWGGLTEAQRRRLRPRTSGASRFRGVTRHKNGVKWVARISVGRRRKYLGTFEDEEEAARAVLEASGSNAEPAPRPGVAA